MEEPKQLESVEETKKVEEGKKKRRRSFWRGYAIGALSALLLVFVVCFVSLSFFRGMTFREDAAALAKLNRLASFLNDQYLGEIDMERLLDGAYSGFVKAVGDPYTRYYTEEEYKEYLEDMEGSYAGIGVSVQWNKETGMLEVLKVNENGPAEKAGILPGDSIYMVGDEIVQGMESDDVIPLIKGEEGTSVKITVLREDSAEPVSMEVTRERIVEETVNYNMLDERIGYIQVTGFDEVTEEQFNTAIQELSAEGMEGLILDLRDNPGGRLNTVTAMADTLLPECTITYTETKQGERRDYTSDAQCLGIPLVLLVNENSASASEVLAGAVQDLKAGILVGVTTYGKGIVQTTIPIADGSAIKLTMANYYTPNGRNIHGIGIEPDIEIALPEGKTFSEVRLSDEDVQLMTAIEAMNTQLDAQ